MQYHCIISHWLSLLKRRFRDIQIVIVTNFVVVSSVGIKTVDCKKNKQKTKKKKQTKKNNNNKKKQTKNTHTHTHKEKKNENRMVHTVDSYRLILDHGFQKVSLLVSRAVRVTFFLYVCKCLSWHVIFKQVHTLPSGHMKFIQRINVDTASLQCIYVNATLHRVMLPRDNIHFRLSSKHATLWQLFFHVTAMSWRRCNVEILKLRRSVFSRFLLFSILLCGII